MGGMSILSGILIVLMVKEPKRQTALDAGEVGRFNLRDAAALFKIPTIWMLAVNLLFITSLVLFAFFVTYVVDVRGWQTADAAILSTAYFAGFAISSMLGGLLGDRFDKSFGLPGRVMMMQL